jgi:pimeloyl-ACP methyl ester carboxylesterase
VSYVDANGVHTYYEGHGSGEPLLLMHGGRSDADSFGQQTPTFAADGPATTLMPLRRS